MSRLPVSRDVRPRGNPDIVAREDVLEEAHESRGAPGLADDPAVQPDRQHPAALGSQLLQRVDQVLGEIPRGDEPVREQELEVVCVERVRDDEVRVPSDVHPVGELVRIRVGVVEKAALLDDETAGRFRPATRVPTDGSDAADAFDGLDRPAHVFALLVLRHVAVVDPAPAVTRNLPAGVDHRTRRLGVALERLADREDGERQPAPVKIRCTRQKPARLPNSNIDSVLRLRRPSVGGAPTTSWRNASDAGSPSSGVFSPPSS